MQSHREILTEAAGRFLKAPVGATVIVRTRSDGARLIRVSASDRAMGALLIAELRNAIPSDGIRYSRAARGWVAGPGGALDEWLKTIRGRQSVAVSWEIGDWADDDPHRLTPAEAFKTLHLIDNAPPEVVKAAYKALALLHHPDAGGDQERMKKVNAAYEVLTNGSQKKDR